MTDEPLYPCAACQQNLPAGAFHRFGTPGRIRPVASRCRQCRREDYYAKRYSDTCACCTKHRALQSNQVCKNCNQESGVRECSRCGKIQSLFLSYFGRSCVCKSCRKGVKS